MADQQQSNIVQENNAARTGLNMDQTLNQVQKGQLTYALNAAVENFDSNSVNYQNEPGNELCLNFPANYHLIGTHAIVEQNKHIFFLANPDTGASEIGYMDNNDCVYHTYINAFCLNFNIDYPIHKAVHKITNCTTEVYWTDGLNPRRFLDLNNIPYVIEQGINVCDATNTTQIDCNKLKIQPNFDIPELKVTEVTNLGNLTAGTYQFAIQYSSAAGDAYTSYYSITNPTPIANPKITTADFNYSVGQSIELNISNLDLTGYFQYYNLAVIKSVNAITSVELVGTYFIDKSTNHITYTGQNQTQIRLTVDDIFEKYPYYDIAQDLTVVQDVLVWDNLTSIDTVNYQRIANDITLNWQTYKLPADENYADALNSTNLRGYLRDEVYAFEIVFLLRNGKQTNGFHIPGRAKNANESIYPDVPTTNPDFIGEPEYVDQLTDIGYSPYWKIYNTASVSGDATGDPIGNATPYQFGEFAYWESLETYPCNTLVWGDLANQPIRHHKFPDVLISPIADTQQPDINLDGTYANLTMHNESVFPIGVRIDIQQIQNLILTSSLTSDQKADIAGFKIVRGDRSTNKSIVGKGILRNVGKYTREENTYYFPNYPYNDFGNDPFLLEKSNAFNDQCNTYNIVPNGANTLNYTECFNGEPAVRVILSTETEPFHLCSLTLPIATGVTNLPTITEVSFETYRITIARETGQASFKITDPLTGQVDYVGVASATFKTDGFYRKSPAIINSSTYPEWYRGVLTYTIEQISSVGNPECYPNEFNGFTGYNDFQYRYVFNSPDTSFGSPFLGNILKLENVMYGAGHAHFVQVRKNALYKLITKEAQQDALQSSQDIASIPAFDPTAMFTAYQAYLQIYINGITRKNYAYSYNSIAEYDYWSDVENNIGVKQRTLDLYQYLIPGVQNVGDDHNINNFDRESSVYLRTDKTKPYLPIASQTPSLLNPIGDPKIEDHSRYTLTSQNTCLTPGKEFDITVVSYYGSLKNVFPNQWGQMYSYLTIDTGFQVNNNDSLAPIQVVFGGDTFINKFAFKTKLPFFIDNRVGAPDDSDIFYDEIGNIAYPRYWHSARSVLSDYSYNPGTTLTNIISYKAHNFDCPNNQLATNNNPGRTFYDGKFYLFAYGIPNFYCESNVNVDLRQAFNDREGDFWPHVSSGIPDNWLQESYVPIAQDNTYYYNVTYSKQNKENYFSHLAVDWSDDQCYTYFPFRAIYSEAQDNSPVTRVNAWLSYMPAASFDFPQNYGNLVSLDGIQNKAILARFENKSLLYNTLLTMNTSNPKAAYIGNDSLFRSSPPIDFAETDLGYVGAQNKMLLKIPQGQITVDAKRGQVFLIAGNQAQDLSGFGSGLNRFFTDHLAFEILRYFPNVPTDNHFNGVGLHGVYDSKYDRVIISKLDYIPQNSDVKYDSTTNDFYIERIIPQNDENISPVVIREIVYLTDIEYFCNKSWTLSFNVNTKSWVSFHSYIPNWYIGENNFFYSGLNDGCDLHAIAVQEVPATTTTTTTYVPDCSMDGTAINITPDCALEGTATTEIPVTTTTTSTSSSTTTSTSTSTTTSTSTSTTTSTTTAVPRATFAGSFRIAVDATSQKAFTVIDTSSVTGHFPTTNVAIGGTSAAITVSGTLTAAQGALKIGLPPNPSPNVVATIVSSTGAATNATITTSTALGYLQVIVTPNSYPSTVTLSGTITIKYIAPTTTTTTTSTSTTTSTTTVAPSYYTLSASNAGGACDGTPGCDNFQITYNGTATLCGCTGINITNTGINRTCFDSNVVSGGTFWVSDGTNVRQFTRTGATYVATVAGSCTSCGVIPPAP